MTRNAESLQLQVEVQQEAIKALRVQLAKERERVRIAEKAAKESRNQLIYSLTSMGAYYWIDNLETGSVTYLSTKLFYDMGYDDHEIPHQLERYPDFVHPDDLPNVTDTFYKYCRGEIERYETEFRFRRKDGSWAWTHNLGYVTRMDGDRAIEVSGITTDISARKAMELELAHSNQELVKANRQLKEMAEKDRLTGIYNRTKLDDVLESELNRAKRYQGRFGIVLIDGCNLPSAGASSRARMV